MRTAVCILLLPPCLAAAQGAVPGRSVDDLRAFFAQNCVKCHGLDGSARDLAGNKLRGFDFTDGRKAGLETDAEMVKKIRKGIFFGLVMPSFKDQLSEEESARMVQEVLRKAEKGKPIVPKAETAR